MKLDFCKKIKKVITYSNNFVFRYTYKLFKLWKRANSVNDTSQGSFEGVRVCIVADSRNTMESGSPHLSDYKRGVSVLAEVYCLLTHTFLHG
jgi:hypothetical protein